MAFDPDKYLAKKQPAFDPDAYLAKVAPVSEIPRRNVGIAGMAIAPIMAAFGREQQKDIARTGLATTVGLAAGPALAAGSRAIGAALPALQRVTTPLATSFATGGFQSGLPQTAPAAARLASRVVGAAVPGAIAGGIMSPEEAASGAAISTGVTLLAPPVAKAIGKSVNTLGRIATGGKANVLLEAAEGRAPEIINALRQQPEIVPGAMPTAGEAAAPLGVTRFSALQESAEEILPSEYMARRQAQDAARAAAIRTVGGTPVQLETARKLRDATAKTNYGAAAKELVEGDEVFNDLLSRPSMDRVMARAEKLASERNQPFVIGQAVPEQRVPSAVLGPDGVPMGETVIPAQTAQYPVQSMHYVKMAFDDLIRDPATFGIGKSEAAAIAGTRGEFLSWLENKAGMYGAARKAFRQQSGPINQMEVGQYLESKLTSALQGEEKLRPAVFAGAVEAAPQTIKKSTQGAVRFEKLSDVLTPDQIKVVEDIRKDLARQSKYREQARFARPAGPNAETAGSQLLTEVVGGVTMPTLLNRVTTIANAIMARLVGKIDRKLAIEIATDMLNPEVAALALETAQRRASTVQKATTGITQGMAAAQRVAAPAAAANALAPAENQNQLRQ